MSRQQRTPGTSALRRYARRQRADPQHLRTTLRLLDPQPGARILEIASGRGYFTRRLDELGAIATGIDANPEAAANAVAKDVRCMQVEGMAFGDGEFDHVLAIHAIEHFPDLQVAFAEMARVLRRGGTMLLVYPAEPIRGLGSIIDAITIYRNPFLARELHLHKLRPSTVQRLGEAAGLEHLRWEFQLLMPQFVTLFRKAD